MDVKGISAVVTGGASGLGLATARRLLNSGAEAVTLVDLPTSDGEAVAKSLGSRARFAAADVRIPREVEAALHIATEAGPLRALVHCAGRGGPVRLVDREGNPGSLDAYREIVEINLVGTFNVLRLAAARMAANEPLHGDRGVCVLTASVAAYEGQIGQIPYASSKAGIVGMTLVAARDLASKAIRVCTIAPGTFDTPLLNRLSNDVRASLAATVPHPSRLGEPAEFAKLAQSVIENGMLNGETIRLDGAIRMAPR
ncbi:MULTISPECIES: SDR family NAD(P)-dependent oxidoreductase [Streptomyces]|uniref:SDR family NAD(P)-dependent oxidoreductase n=1 Tax=Streptomyces doudnae TaxID=3075536 RepID=A0ABD5EWD9_9ACTN|nr:MULTISPECIES: SDR family NAD(P)-dependent oxidoreductase [unclassified Streptomyces]MDT0438645.1 SDR family NAD(P)-dependent oxidoreductase [Streptomyces sp. DSM 41981]MYQ69071.1 SDR family NAD(P)-dependent oxidoreductase [Streptomyces sp. SID4950]SCE51149.1 NAD(P)-dependent dehydrogenase, short-chain alcohol dehydrogenase family [Streptomyces sp. SolWspMP-5a-2]